MFVCDNCGIEMENKDVADTFEETFEGKEHLFERVGFENWVEGIRRGIVSTVECFECDDGILS